MNTSQEDHPLILTFLEKIEAVCGKMHGSSAGKPLVRQMGREILTLLGTPLPDWAVRFETVFAEPEPIDTESLAWKVYAAAKEMRQSGAPRVSSQKISKNLGFKPWYVLSVRKLKLAYEAGRDLKDFPRSLMKEPPKK